MQTRMIEVVPETSRSCVETRKEIEFHRRILWHRSCFPKSAPLAIEVLRCIEQAIEKRRNLLQNVSFVHSEVWISALEINNQVIDLLIMQLT